MTVSERKEFWYSKSGWVRGSAGFGTWSVYYKRLPPSLHPPDKKMQVYDIIVMKHLENGYSVNKVLAGGWVNKPRGDGIYQIGVYPTLKSAIDHAEDIVRKSGKPYPR
jgi:hypothetical protein